MQHKWQETDVPEEVLARAHFIQRDKRQRDEEPAHGQIVRVAAGMFCDSIRLITNNVPKGELHHSERLRKEGE